MNSKKTKNKFVIIMLTCMIALSSIWAGRTFAYFNASNNATGTITMGTLQLTDATDSTDASVSVSNIVPNQTINKSFKATVKSDIKYYKRVSLTASVTPLTGKSHSTGCKENFKTDLDILEAEITGFSPVTDNDSKITYYYDITPVTPTSDTTTEEFAVQIKIKDTVGDGGCDYYMGATINIGVKIEVIQADYLEDNGLANASTFTAAALHAIWGSVVGSSGSATPTPTPSTGTYTRVNANGDVDSDGDYILFGYYPKTVATSAELASITSTNKTDSDGYYLDANGNRYKKFTANPSEESYTFSDGTSITSGTEYYFKLEQIKWRILETNGTTAMILAEDIIDAHSYHNSYEARTIDGKTIYPSNYKESEIRAWLNGYSYTGTSGTVSTYNNNGFLQTAFTTAQQNIIQTTKVDNSLASTLDSSNSYICEDTNDKIFLLSRKELTTAAYGFSTDKTEYDTARRKQTTDYAKANYAYTSTSTDYLGNGWWWSRSPYYLLRYAWDVYSDGDANYRHDVSVAYGGVVPALVIAL